MLVNERKILLKSIEVIDKLWMRAETDMINSAMPPKNTFGVINNTCSLLSLNYASLLCILPTPASVHKISIIFLFHSLLLSLQYPAFATNSQFSISLHAWVIEIRVFLKEVLLYEMYLCNVMFPSCFTILFWREKKEWKKAMHVREDGISQDTFNVASWVFFSILT